MENTIAVTHFDQHHPLNRSHNDSKGERIQVILPDMFMSFLSQPPRLNSNYQKVKIESEAWMVEYVLFTCIHMRALLMKAVENVAWTNACRKC